MVSERLTGNLQTDEVLLRNAPFAGDVSILDAFVGFGPAFVTLFLGQQIVPEDARFILFGVCAFLAFIGFLGLVVAPDHTPLGTYASRYWHHQRRPPEVRYRRKTEQDILDRGLIEYDERTQELSHVEKIYPQYDVIELDDGRIVGAVEVFAGNLDTADAERQQSIVRSVRDFFNNSLDFPITFYITTHGFEPESMLRDYRERLEDDVARNNAIIQYYINHHIRWVGTRMGGQPMREYYVLVPVTEREVYESLGGEETVGNSLNELPIVGALVGKSDEEEYSLSPDELKLRQISLVDERIGSLEGNFVSSIGEEADSQRVEAGHFAALLKEYWEGEQVDRDDFAEKVGMSPVTIGKTDDIET